MYYAEIWYDGELWVRGTDLVIKAENNWRDGRPQVAVQLQLPPFL